MASISSEENLPQRLRDLEDEEGSIVFQPQNPYPREQSEEDRRNKKACKSKCINGSLVALKTLLFIFYGGVGTISTWLNHTQVSSRFSERESLLIYGISALLSVVTPIIFGLVSDKTAQPRKVLGICLLLAGLLYPLIMAVPPAEPYRYRERLQWCKDTLKKDQSADSTPFHTNSDPVLFGDSPSFSSTSSCIPNRLACTATQTELITDFGGGCSDGCYGKLIISKCHFKCNDSLDYDYESSLPVASAQTAPREDEEVFEQAPHLCVNGDRLNKNKYKKFCYAFDKYMHEIVLNATEISGYTDHDGKCHYPLTSYSESGVKQNLLYCSPVEQNCHVSCELRWDTSGKDDQWTCRSDYVSWLISFICFTGIHALGTMLVISAAGLLNSAILSMSHEHSGYFGCQYTYAALGFALVPPGVVLLFDFIHENLEVPWNLEYLAAYSIWLFACALLVFCLPYHAEWVPKPKTVGPMLRRWTSRPHTTMFLIMIGILGVFQILNDVLSFHQIKSVGGSLLLISLGAAASVGPALLFICRVEKVVDYCGHDSIFAIALVVLSLQFTGYAYLTDVEPEWSMLLKAMETFSILMVWITASYTTYTAAPRSLAGTCQSIIVTIYCCIGRGVGGVVGYIGLTFIPKDLFLKIIALLSVFICVIYLILHYCCLKPLPYSRQYDLDRPGSATPSGRYTPLKLINGKKGEKNLAKDEDLDEKEINAPDEL